MDTILNLLPLTDDERAQFLAAAPDADHVFLPVNDMKYPDGHVSLDRLARATIIFGCVPPHMLSAAPGLKWLQTWSAGVDPYLAPGVLPQGAILTSAIGAYGQAVSEHMLSSLLAVLKRLPAYRDDQRERRWSDEGKVRSLVDATVLLLGTGDLGSHFAQLVKALGARTVGLNRHPDKPVAGIDQLFHLSQLEDWLPRADVVAMTLPETPETIHIINAQRLSLMKPTAVLVNAGRGSGVDCRALAQALKDGTIWGAALDVTEPEPLPPEHPLWDCPTLLLTPHVAGFAHLDATVRRVVAITLDNLKRYQAGEPMCNRFL